MASSNLWTFRYENENIAADCLFGVMEIHRSNVNEKKSDVNTEFLAGMASEPEVLYVTSEAG